MCYLPEFRESVLRFATTTTARSTTSGRTSQPPVVLEGQRRHAAERLVYGGVLLGGPGRDGAASYDTVTGELIPEIWERWLAVDPVRMVAGNADTLRSMRAIYIDCGKRDQFYLDLGAEAFRLELEKIGVHDYFFELFDATHMGIEYRYPISLRYLAERLSV
jgi:hypothetical protein